MGMNIDSDTLIIAVTKDIEVIDGHIIIGSLNTKGECVKKSIHNYVKVTQEQFDSMFNC